MLSSDRVMLAKLHTPSVGLHRLTKSGRGLPVAFFSAPVMTKAAPDDSNRPKIPMFSSHSRSFMRYLPLYDQRPLGPRSCVKRPSSMSV